MGSLFAWSSYANIVAPNLNVFLISESRLWVPRIFILSAIGFFAAFYQQINKSVRREEVRFYFIDLSDPEDDYPKLH